MKSDFITIDIEIIEKCVRLLKPSKAAGHDGLVSEHIFNSHPSIFVYLKLLFTMMLTHSYVPNAFGLGIVIPIVKNKHGDVSSIDNYRPITLSPVISKLFESLLLELYQPFLKTDNLQFGFKKDVGCSNAIFAVRQVIEYFNERGSNVYVAALDASKAFDRVNFYKLFSSLIHCGLPVHIIDSIVNWYSKLSIVVRWCGQLSAALSVLSGVRQGGILSPILFNLYVNTVITNLRKSGLGCHFRNSYIGCIMYADDLILLSASVVELQSMLDSCGDVGNGLGIKFNASKSMCMVVGPNKMEVPSNMNINGSTINWVDRIKYLGVTIISAKVFSLDFSETRRKFYMSVNGILSKCKHVSDIVKLELMEKHCLPILTYSIECIKPTKIQLLELNSWWNSVYRKIFGYNKWESVKRLIFMLERLDLLHVINMRQILFAQRIMSSSGFILNDVCKYYSDYSQLKTLQEVYGVHITWSKAKIKAIIFKSFRNMVNPSE